MRHFFAVNHDKAYTLSYAHKTTLVNWEPGVLGDEQSSDLESGNSPKKTGTYMVAHNICRYPIF